jgi:hypothetical protein
MAAFLHYRVILGKGHCSLGIVSRNLKDAMLERLKSRYQGKIQI